MIKKNLKREKKKKIYSLDPIVKPGSIILVSSTNTIGKIIQWFLKIVRKKKGLPVPRGLVANHVGVIVDLWGSLYVAEALADGINVRPFSRAYGGESNRIKVLNPVKPYSAKEKIEISKTAITDALSPTKYDYFGLLHQVIYTFTNGKWVGKKGAKANRKLYCSEAVAKWVNTVRRNTFSKQEAVTPVDIEFNKYYKVEFQGDLIKLKRK